MASSSSSSSYLVLPVLFLLVKLVILLSPLCSVCCSTGSVVTHLPGFNGPLPFYLETGYVGVDEANDTQLFYYFVKSERNPKEDPLILWLTGGPGCSGISALVFEIGPLKYRVVKYDGSLPTLYYFADSWTKVSSIVFLDSPVGSGFSFSRRMEEYDVSDISSSELVVKFMRKWFVDHPQFLGNPFYIGGNSYAGMVVPFIAKELMEGSEAGIEPILNFEGYILGNPVTRELVEQNSQVPYAHNMGIISDELYKMATKTCEGEYFATPRNAQCTAVMEVVDQFFDELNKEHILEPKCPKISPKPETIDENRRYLGQNHAKVAVPPAVPALYCRNYEFYLSYHWANNKDVSKALHVQQGTVDEWERCSTKFNYTYDMDSNIKDQHDILERIPSTGI